MTTGSDLLAAANLLEHLPKLLKETRQIRELSLLKTAEVTGIAPTTIHRCEHGKGVHSNTAVILLRWMAE